MHDIGVANNTVMQDKLYQAIAETAEISKKFAAQEAAATKYYQAIDSAMSMKHTEETDDTTIQTQYSVFVASQDQQFTSI